MNAMRIYLNLLVALLTFLSAHCFGAVQLPAPSLSVGNQSSNSVQLNWNWPGNSVSTSGITVNVRDLDTGYIVSGYPITLPKNYTYYNFTGLASGHNHRFSVNYKAANSSYADGGSTIEVTTLAAAPEQLPAPSLSVGNITSNSVLLEWNWSGNSVSTNGITINVRDLDTGYIVSGYPITLPKNYTYHNFIGLASGHTHRFSVNYKAANSSYVDGGSTTEVKTTKPAPTVTNNQNPPPSNPLPSTGNTSTPPPSSSSKFEITHIPGLMRNIGWNTAADLMDHWFKGTGKSYTLSIENIKKLSSKRSDEIVKAITNWKDSSTFDEGLLNLSETPRNLLITELRSTNGYNPPLLAKGGKFDFRESELSFPNTDGWLEMAAEQKRMHWIQEAKIQPYNITPILIGFDEYTAAIGKGVLRLVPAGTVFVANNQATITITGVGIYFRDGYDFVDWQPLGCWSVDSPYLTATCASDSIDLIDNWTYVENEDFRAYNRGKSLPDNHGNFRIFSEMLKYDYPSPYTFTVPLTDSDLQAHTNAVKKMFSLTESAFPIETRASLYQQPTELSDGNFVKHYDISGTALYFYDGYVFYTASPGGLPIRIGTLSEWLERLQ